MTDDQPPPVWTEGPARYFRPVWARNATGWTYHGPSGYGETASREGGPIVLNETEEGGHRMRTNRKQRWILALARRMAKRNAENADDARKIAALGCDCVKLRAWRDGAVHLATCPVQIAYDASRAGLYETDLADFYQDAEPAREEPKDIRHLAEPFRKTAGRATCPECGRHARSEGEIRHREACSRTDV